MSRRFYKMSGSGNDFVFLDGREHTLAGWPAERIRRVCDRRRGVGGDGIVLLTPVGEGFLRMEYYNADGSHADMCGNAALCASRLAVHLGLAIAGASIALATDAGRLESRTFGGGWQAELRFPEASVPAPIDLPLIVGERRAFHGVVGVPHAILEVADIRSVDVQGRGRELRFATQFGEPGANVNFIGPTGDPEVPWALRTYERGVEAETLACGTGTIAAALALAAAGDRLPMRIRSGSGSVYSVSGAVGESVARDVWLAGEGRLVFTGELVAE